MINEYSELEFKNDNIYYWENLLLKDYSNQLPINYRNMMIEEDFHDNEKIIYSKKIPQEIIERIKDCLGDNEEVTMYHYFVTFFVIIMIRYRQEQDILLPILFEDRKENFIKMLSLKLPPIISFEALLNKIIDLDKEINEKTKLHLKNLESILNKQKEMPTILKTIFHYSEIIDEYNTAFTIKEFSDFHNDCIHVFIHKKVNDYYYSVKYSPKFYAKEAIEFLFNHYCEIINNSLNNKEKDIYFIDIMNSREREKILFDWNQTKQFYPQDYCLHQLIENIVVSNPNGIAIIHEDKEITYSELNEISNRIAHYLIKLGVKKNYIVGIYIEKTFKMVAALIGVLKAGGAYLPMDTSYPIQRIQYMLEDSKTEFLISDSSLVENISVNSKMSVILLDRNDEIILKQSIVNPQVNVTPENFCYVIYTSGSTGNPKGVVLNHKGRVNNFYDFNSRFRIREGDRLLSVSSPSFDMCAYDILGTLAAGATIIFPNRDLQNQPMHWLRLISKYEITIWHSVPVMLELLCKCAEIRMNMKLNSLRLFLLGGDWISVSLPNRIKELDEACKIVSLGGASEVSMDSTIYIIQSVNPNWPSIPYGKPMANQKTYILDNKLEPLPAGIPGELFIGGIGVGQGYYNREELTKEKFLTNPWGTDPDERIYRTGDWARYLPDGNIQLLGRIDLQVKINGVRIELGEIEAHLKTNLYIKDAVVLALDKSDNAKKIVAYIVFKSYDTHLSIAELKSFIRQKMPISYVPSNFIFLEELPLTPNGKVNRKALSNMRII